MDDSAADSASGLRFRAGDSTAYHEMVATHAATVLTYATRVVGPADAEEVTQDTFVAAWRNADRFDPERGSIVGWLIGIARNKCVDHIRANARWTRNLETGKQSTTTVESEADVIAERLLLTEALLQLNDRQRRHVELSLIKGMPHEEISAMTDSPLGTVKSDIRRGTQLMRRYLTHRNFEGSPT